MRKAHRGVKYLLYALMSLVICAAVAVGVYVYRCTHYWQADMKKTVAAGFVEKQVSLPDGSVINYAQGPNNGDALLLIHGQTTAWEDYARVLPALAKDRQVFAVDVYGHGDSSHDPNKYYIDANGDDLIWFINNVIGKRTVVSGHSSGGLLAAYVAAYGGDLVVGAVLEDPPVFSTQRDYYEKSFAFHDASKPIYDYLNSEQSECWEAYYLRNCLWGRLYAASAKDSLADHAQKLHERQPDKPIQFFYMPESINIIFLYMREYDLRFGVNFYDYSWHSDIAHAELMRDIDVPTVFIHAKAQYSEDGILLAASSDEQARMAADLIGDCELIEIESNHNIHRFNPDVFVDAVKLITNASSFQ